MSKFKDYMLSEEEKVDNYSFFIGKFVQKFSMPNTRKEALIILSKTNLDVYKKKDVFVGLYDVNKKERVRITKKDLDSLPKANREALLKYKDTLLYADFL